MTNRLQYGSLKATKTLFLRTAEAQRSQCVGRVPRLEATGATQREEREEMLN
ncbi:MAG: hypothetical protein V7K94_10560 [Nostoc sp.]|uniref:hypothetical protein n=1 Tax=Nostoc sp. TaxID=1180 RepID=UPI002FFBD619